MKRHRDLFLGHSLTGDDSKGQTDVQQLRHIFSNLPSVPWESSVDEHATQLATSIKSSISTQWVQAFPTPRHSPKKSYISDSTWALRGERIWRTRHLRTAKTQLSHLTIREAISSLYDDHALVTTSIFVQAFRLLCVCIGHGAALKTLAGQLHSALRADRTM